MRRSSAAWRSEHPHPSEGMDNEGEGPRGPHAEGERGRMIEDYRKARRAAQKQVQRDISAGRYPYPVALSDILQDSGYQGEVPIGVMEIDMALIAGTRTHGRQNSFSRGFMPLLEDDSEFAAKWSVLIDSQREEGLHEPIVVYEYLQRFYVQEGNKRVSVMRYLDMPSITANVTRVLPMPSDSKESRIYQEFLRFYRVAPIYGFVFSNEGSYERLAVFAGHDLDNPWPDDDVKTLRSAFSSFAESFQHRGGERLGMTAGDAFLIYLKIYGYELAVCGSPTEIADRLGRIWGELRVSTSRLRTSSRRASPRRAHRSSRTSRDSRRRRCLPNRCGSPISTSSARPHRAGRRLMIRAAWSSSASTVARSRPRSIPTANPMRRSTARSTARSPI